MYASFDIHPSFLLKINKVVTFLFSSRQLVTTGVLKRGAFGNCNHMLVCYLNILSPIENPAKNLTISSQRRFPLHG